MDLSDLFYDELLRLETELLTRLHSILGAFAKVHDYSMGAHTVALNMSCPRTEMSAS